MKPKKAKVKALKAWAVLLPGTHRITSSTISYCPDGTENNSCLKYDLYEREAAAVYASNVYPASFRQVVPVLITPINPKRKKVK